MGLLDEVGDFLSTPVGIGLLSAAFGGAAGARRGTPWNNTGRAGLAGLAGYSQAQALQDRTAQEQQERQLRNLQIKKYTDDLDYEGKAAKEKAAFADALTRAKQFVPASNLTGMEKTRPGQTIPGFVGNVDQEIQKVLADPQIPNEDKMGIVAQIKKQSEVGGKTQFDPFTLIGSGVPRAAELGKALQSQEFTHEENRLKANDIASRVGPEKDYSVPVYLKDGSVAAFDTRRQTLTPLAVGGAPAIAAQHSPELQSRIAAGKSTGKETGELNVKQHESAISAADNLYKIDALLSHVKTSDAITGLGADIFKNIERAKVLLGNKAAQGKVSDTELLDVMMGSEVFPMIGSLGIGARGMDTPAEREFMRKVLTGEISLNKDTIVRMAEIRKNISKRAIEKWNARVDKGELDDYFTTSGRTNEKIAFPTEEPKAANAPATLPPAVQHKGKLIKDTETGELLRSNGMTWVKEK